CKRGETWQRKGELERAMGDYSEAIRLDPRQALAYRHRAELWQRQGNLTAARADAEQSVKLAPQQAESLVVRAQVLKALGRKSDAIDDYRKALALTPSEETRRAAAAGLKELGEGSGAAGHGTWQEE